jgi:RNA polymerase-binding transcription factor DksA
VGRDERRCLIGRVFAHGSEECDDCGEDIPAARRAALQGARTCVVCQSKRDASICQIGINRRGSKDSQLR